MLGRQRTLALDRAILDECVDGGVETRPTGRYYPASMLAVSSLKEAGMAATYNADVQLPAVARIEDRFLQDDFFVLALTTGSAADGPDEVDEVRAAGFETSHFKFGYFGDVVV